MSWSDEELVKDALDKTFGDDWKLIWATRNRIAHGYAYIDVRMIRDTVDQDLPDFERKLQRSRRS